MSYSFKNMFYTIGDHFRHHSSIYILILCVAGFIGGLAYYINYKIDEDSKQVIVYAVTDQRQDYLSIIRGL